MFSQMYDLWKQTAWKFSVNICSNSDINKFQTDNSIWCQMLSSKNRFTCSVQTSDILSNYTFEYCQHISEHLDLFFSICKLVPIKRKVICYIFPVGTKTFFALPKTWLWGGKCPCTDSGLVGVDWLGNVV